MVTVTEYIRKHLEDSLLPHIGIAYNSVPDLDEMNRNLEVIRKVYALCDNRLRQGMFRYGTINPRKIDVDRHVKEAVRRVEYYQQTGDTEGLVDAINFLKLAVVASPEEDFRSTNKRMHYEGTDKEISSR